MRINKKVLILIILLIAVILLLLIWALSGVNRQTARPAIIPTPAPTLFIAPTQSVTQDTIKQGQSDARWNQLEQKYFSEHPWASKLPKRTTSYFVGYDGSKNVFFADIYESSGSVEAIEKEVTDYLLSIGIDLTKYKIEFTVYPTQPTL